MNCLESMGYNDNSNGLIGMLENLGYAISLIGYHPNGRYLDLGCGYGFLKDMLPPDITYVGIDKIKRKNVNYIFEFDIREAIKVIKPKEFDYILCMGVFRYFDSPQECYDFMNFVLKDLLPKKFLVRSRFWGGEDCNIEKLPKLSNYNRKVIFNNTRVTVLYEVK
jgi:SAM-dependent methyltransferase